MNMNKLIAEKQISMIVKTLAITIALMVIICSIPATMETQSRVQIIDSSELTHEMLRNRNGNIIIEECIGIVTSEKGDGEILNCLNPKQNYISYKCVENANVGDTILTYFIFNPETDYIDDILYRFDYIIG